MNSYQTEMELANQYFEKGKTMFRENPFNDYCDLFTKASVIYQKHQQWEQYLMCRDKIATWNTSKWQLKEALQIAEENLKLYESKEVENKFLKAELHYRLFFTHFYLLNYKKAIYHTEQCLDLALQIDNTYLIVKSYTAISGTYLHRHNYIHALPFLFKALQYAKLLKNEESLQLIHVYLNMGHIYQHLHQLHLARNYFLRSIRLFKLQFGEDYPHIANAKIMLGLIEVMDGEESKAKRYFQEAVSIKQKYKIVDSELATCLIELGQIHFEQKEWETAFSYLNKGIDIQKQINNKDVHWFFNAYYNLAELSIKKGDFEEANDYLQKIENLAVGEDANFYLGGICLSQANISILKKEYPTALQFLQKAHEHWLKGNQKKELFNHEPPFQLFSKKLKLCSSIYEITKSAKYLEAFFQFSPHIDQFINRVHPLVFDVKDRLNVNQEFLWYYHTMVDFLFEKSLIDSPSNTLKKAFAFAEKSKVHGLLSNLKDAEALQLTQIPTEKLRDLQKLQLKVTEAEKQAEYALYKGEENLQDEYAHHLITHQIAYHQFITELEKDYPEYLQFKYQLPEINLNELQAQLQSHTAIIEYAFTNKHLYVFCIGKHFFEAKRLQYSSKFQHLLELFLDDAILGLNRKRYTQLGFHLYEMLLAPIESILRNNHICELLIIPDKQLLELPFESLLSQTTNYRMPYSEMPYLLRGYKVCYHYSVTLWAYQQSRKKEQVPNTKDFMGFAPVYAYGHKETLSAPAVAMAVRDVNIGGANYQALLYSEKEVQGIGASFEAEGKSAQIHLRADANLTQFKEILNRSSAKYIHIAAHSVLNQEEEELLGILFSPSKTIPYKNPESESTNIAVKRTTNQPKELDMILYPNEVHQLQLKSDLVFLSCCKSGIGKIVEGEGMLSINRSFLYAGASNIVFTLFKIYDEKTAIFAHHFYDYLLNQTEDYAAALRYAKLQLLKENLPPRYWGGFLLLGN